MREADEVAAWISDRKAVASSDEMGKDLEHVEMLQKNFADSLKVFNTISRREEVIASSPALLSLLAIERSWGRPVNKAKEVTSCALEVS